MPTNTATSRNPSSASPTPDPIAELRAHDDVEKVVEYDDDTRLDGAMVILDWVTNSTMENGTRIIHDKNYTGEIRRVSSFIDELAGVKKTRASKTGIARYTIHIDFL